MSDEKVPLSLQCETCKKRVGRNYMTINYMKGNDLIKHLMICDKCKLAVDSLLWRLKK